MLKALRQGGFIKSLMGTIVVLIIIAFALDYRGNGLSMDGAQDCAVTVDEECVPLKDYNMLVRLVAPPGASDKEIKKAGFNTHAVNALVERHLLLKEAKRLGVAVSEDDIDDELAIGRVHFSWPVSAPMPQAIAQGMPYPTTGANELTTYIRVKNSKTDEFDYEIYRRQLQTLLRMSPREFKDAQAEEITAARVRALVTSAVRVSEDEAFAAYEHDKSQAIARSVNLPRAWFERYAVAGTDKDAEAFATTSADKVNELWESAKGNWRADCALVSEIKIPFEPGSEEGSEHGVEKAQAEMVQGLVRGGFAFDRAARAFGKSSNARYGGAVGCFDADKLPEGGQEIAKALESLKAGEVTDVLQAGKSFVIYKFLGKLDAAGAERVGRLELARKGAIEQAARERAQALGKDLLAKAKSGSDLSQALDEALPLTVNVEGANEEGAKAIREEAKTASERPEFEVSRSFNRAGSPIPGLKQRNVAQRLFDLAKPDQVVDEVLETYAGFAIVQLKELTLATREEFAKDKDAMVEALKEQKRSDALEHYIARLREKAKKVVVNTTLEGSGDTQTPAPGGTG